MLDHIGSPRIEICTRISHEHFICILLSKHLVIVDFYQILRLSISNVVEITLLFLSDLSLRLPGPRPRLRRSCNVAPSLLVTWLLLRWFERRILSFRVEWILINRHSHVVQITIFLLRVEPTTSVGLVGVDRVELVQVVSVRDLRRLSDLLLFGDLVDVVLVVIFLLVGRGQLVSVGLRGLVRLIH